uniref:hypothetical protein n=1 Tax=uncultured Dysgonomonas sp. TaxID=206096 RepID=UPI002586AD54|nr:hypothetical protein [uncultured Dysgonomonas sp.]
MKKLDEVKTLRRNVSAIRTFFNASLQKYKSDSRCDKFNYGFNIDDRFKACQGKTITFDSWAGYFGDSGCSNILSLSSEIFNKHLLKYLNNNKHTIMLAIADSIEKEASSLKGEAEKELQAELDKLKELDDPMDIPIQESETK